MHGTHKQQALKPHIDDDDDHSSLTPIQVCFISILRTFFSRYTANFGSHFRKQRPFQKHDYSDFVSETEITETKKEPPGFTFTQNTHTKKHTSKCSLLSNSCMCR